jgi:hypothetical protein
MIRFIDVDMNSPGVPKPFARLVPESAPTRFWWWGGQSWEGKLNGPLVIEIQDPPSQEAPAGLTDFMRTANQWIVSSRLKSELEALNAEIEFWPVDLNYQNRTASGQYFAANSIYRVKAVDIDNSDVDIDPELGDALSVRRLVLDESKILPRHWAFVDEVQRIAVSEDLQAALAHSSSTGFRFIDPSDVRY